jgi:hypothetical protein
MSDQNTDPNTAKPTSLGIYDKPRRDPVTAVEIIAVTLSVVWLAGAVVFFVFVPDAQTANFQGIPFVVTMMAVFLPVAMIWVAATAARTSRIMREESQRLQTAIDAIRQAYVAQQQRGNISSEPSVTRKLEEIAQAAKKTETTLATFSSSRSDARRATSPAPANSDTPEDQGFLELGTPAADLSPPLPTDDFIRALNFPETAEDEAGFAALRRALRDRKAAQLIQAAQDVLTLLSQDGIYMDDLRPDKARPEIWRDFASGTRGRGIAALGGIRDRSSLALTAGRMKQDPIFRDAAHHFLRLFDRMFAEFEPEATDAEIAGLGDTRTARAFMLLGRVTGTFN